MRIKKRLFLFTLAAPVLLLGGAAIWLSQPTGAFCAIGPNTKNARWVSIEDANRKPVIDLELPVVGRFLFPRPPIEYVGKEDPQIVAGYIVVPKSGSMAWADVQSDHALFSLNNKFAHSFGPMMPVVYASSKERRRRTLLIDGEPVAIDLPYDATKLPALFDPVQVQAGPYKISGTVIGAVAKIMIFRGKIEGPPFKSAKITNTFPYQSTVAGAIGNVATFTGRPLRDGRVKVEFTFEVMYGREWVKYPVNAYLMPKKVEE